MLGMDAAILKVCKFKTDTACISGIRPSIDSVNYVMRYESTHYSRQASMCWAFIGPTTQNQSNGLRWANNSTSTVETLVLDQCWAIVSTPTMTCCQQLQPLHNVAWPNNCLLSGQRVQSYLEPNCMCLGCYSPHPTRFRFRLEYWGFLFFVFFVAKISSQHS